MHTSIEVILPRPLGTTNTTTLEDYMNRLQILRKARQVEGYLNCKLFVQEVLSLPKINNAPKVPLRQLQVGYVLQFLNGLHYAIYLGENDVIEVEGWGEKPRLNKLSTLIAEYELPTVLKTYTTGG